METIFAFILGIGWGMYALAAIQRYQYFTRTLTREAAGLKKLRERAILFIAQLRHANNKSRKQRNALHSNHRGATA